MLCSIINSTMFAVVFSRMEINLIHFYKPNYRLCLLPLDLIILYLYRIRVLVYNKYPIYILMPHAVHLIENDSNVCSALFMIPNPLINKNKKDITNFE